MIPRATYRLQFRKEFPFAAAEELVGYFAQLGISHIYASPILTARAGSPHGYDVVDHRAVNPELGGEAGFRRLAAALDAHGIGIILDIVPNHMAVGGTDNSWWLDVLENGADSRFAPYFDIDWKTDDPMLNGKVLIPVLGASYAESLRAGDLALMWDEALGKLTIAYFRHRFPLCPRDYPLVLGDADAPESADLSRHKTPDGLHAILQRQNFLLAWWRTARDRINWRRFFDISELAALRVEDPDVFAAVHDVPLRLYGEGLIDGIRVDHIDGLADPAGYCRRLRHCLESLRGTRPKGPRQDCAYLIVEKVLSAGETLPDSWPVDGTTGYDFMEDVSALLHDPAGEEPLSRLWETVSGRKGDFTEEDRKARNEILRDHFESQLRSAAAAFANVAADSPQGQDLSTPLLRRAVILLIANLRCYRTYATGTADSPELPHQFRVAQTAAMRQAEEDEQVAITFIADTMEGRGLVFDPAGDAARRFNQLAASIAAKAVEDTALYRYGRLLSRNDVGFTPMRFSMTAGEFHEECRRRGGAWRHAMLATATHDHKRGEDVRARLAVLSEIPEEWEKTVSSWFALNKDVLHLDLDPADEYQLYQTVVGIWPADLNIRDRGALRALTERVQAWRKKSLAEAKENSSWTAPDRLYEAVSSAFIDIVLDPDRSPAFLDQLAAFVDRIAAAGAANGLVQTALRCTVPGVPDLYQGAEYWDYSLVDPDNRRPVDFDARIGSLTSDTPLRSLAADWKDGRLKQSLTQRLLALRRDQAALFAIGEYRPLEIVGPRKDHALAFLRRRGEQWVLVAVALRLAGALRGGARLVPPAAWWQETRLAADGFSGGKEFASLVDGLPVPGRARLADLFNVLPICILGRA